MEREVYGEEEGELDEEGSRWGGRGWLIWRVRWIDRRRLKGRGRGD